MRLNNGINKKPLLTLAISLLISLLSTAQQNKTDFWNNVRFGGGFSLNFGNEFFGATIAPSGIYEFNNQFALGLGLNATFNNQKGFYKSTILGASIIGLYNVIDELQLSAEFEELNVSRRYSVQLNIINDNYWVPALFFGAGYRQGNIAFGIRYDVLYNENKSVYIDPWVPFLRFYF